MNLLLLGDLHTELQWINSHVKTVEKSGTKIDAVIQLGDFGFWKNFGPWKNYLKGHYKFNKLVIAIPGNHERFSDCQEVMGFNPRVEVENFHLMSLGELFTLTDGKESIKILGVGGAKCVDNPKEFYPFNTQQFIDVEVEYLKNGSPNVDLLITHECPFDVGVYSDPLIAARFNLNMNIPCGDENLRSLWEVVRPKLQINGHYHIWNEYMSQDGLKHLTLPMGHQGFAILDTKTWRYEKC